MKSGWLSASLSEVAIVQSGAGFPEKHQGHTDRQIPFYKVSDMNIVGNEREMVYANNSISEDVRLQLGAKIYPKGSTIFPKIGGAIATNKKRLTTTNSCVDNNVMGVIPKEDKITSEFLFYFFQSFNLSDFANDAHLPSIKSSVVSNWGIKLPRSLSEQQRIVNLLVEAFDGIATAKANAEKNLLNARELFGRLSGSILEQLTPISRIASLESLVKSDCSLSYGIVQPGDEVVNGLPIVRPVDLGCDVVTLDGLKRIDPTLARSYDRTTLKGNEILLCVRGSTGVLAIADAQLAGANVTRGIVPIRFDESQISQDFGYCLMRSGPVQEQIRDKTYGTALMQINIRDLRRLTMLVPPNHEQKVAVKRFGELEAATDQLVETYERKIAALDDLKKSLLHRAFNGDL